MTERTPDQGDHKWPTTGNPWTDPITENSRQYRDKLKWLHSADDTPTSAKAPEASTEIPAKHIDSIT